MSVRDTPFGLVFGEIARERFPAIARALRAERRPSADRDAFVLLEPVAHLLDTLTTEDVSPDEREAHLILLHHAYRHWEAGGWVFRVGEETLARAARGEQLSSRVPRPALYVQVPAGRVWRAREEGPAPEPLDGMFATEGTDPTVVSVLGVLGMHRARPGFSAVGIEGRVDPGEAAGSEIEIASRRPDGSPPFAPLLTGGAGTGLYSLANPGELLLLTCRILAMLPETGSAEPGTRIDETDPPAGERVIDV